MASPVTGTPNNVSTDPRSVSIGGIAFSPVPSNDQWALIVAAWGANPKKELVVEYAEGPPKTITKITGA